MLFSSFGKRSYAKNSQLFAQKEEDAYMAMGNILSRLAAAQAKIDRERLQPVVQQARAIANPGERVEWLKRQSVRDLIHDLTSLATVIVMSFDEGDRALAIYHLIPEEQGEKMADLVRGLARSLPPPEVWLGTS